MDRPDEHATQDVPRRLRVLIADEERTRLTSLKALVERLGHEVVASELEVRRVAALSAETDPDVAIVALGESAEHALDLISEIVRDASSPVIALLATNDDEFIHEAARRGLFAYIVDTTDDQLRNAIDITLQRFGEYQNLQGAFGRRALIEQAKGILMGRRGIAADEAFALLRRHSQSTGRGVSVVAEAVIDAHVLLPPEPVPSTPQSGRPTPPVGSG